MGPSAGKLQAWNSWPQFWTAEPWLEANLLGQAGSWYPKQKPKRLGLKEAALNLSSLRCLSQKCLSSDLGSVVDFQGITMKLTGLSLQDLVGSLWRPQPDIPQNQRRLRKKGGRDQRGQGRRGREGGSLREEKRGERMVSDLQKYPSSLLLSVDPKRCSFPFLLQPTSWTLFSFQEKLFFSARSGQHVWLNIRLCRPLEWPHWVSATPQGLLGPRG